MVGLISFIYVSIILMWLFLIMSFASGEYTIAMLASMGMIVAGIFIAVNGAGNVDNLLTQAFALIHIMIGAYLFIRGTAEKAQEALG